MNAKRKADAVFLPATPESAHEILWLGQLFDLDIKSPLKIRTDSSRFLIGQSMAEKILSGSYQPKVTGFRQGKKPRPYQLAASELLKAVNGYLLADDLGLGKTISAVTALTDPALRPAVVVLPTHLAKQWAEKIHEFVKGFRVHEIKTMKLYELPKYRRCDRCGKWIEVERQTKKSSELAKSTTCFK
jgi:SNF2 family DNA or RNA helicase